MACNEVKERKKTKLSPKDGVVLGLHLVIVFIFSCLLEQRLSPCFK